MDSVLKLDRVNKEFQSFHAVKDLSLELRAGEFVTLLGPSGCGKSTTLRMVAGFEEPTNGQILIAGVDSTRIPPHKRNVNMVFQDYALFPHLNVTQNVAFGLELKGWSKPDIAKRVEELLALVQLEAFAHRAPNELSGGQRQRVALARALAPDPPLLLLDEPLGALDAKLRRDMQIELRNLQRTTGKTFVLVTHDQEEALTMSDTVVVMNKGLIEQVGSPQDLYNNPRTEFVARFIGEMNFIPVGTSRQVDAYLETTWEGFNLRAPNDGAAGNKRLFAVRPENVVIETSTPKAAMRNAVCGRVEQRIFRGNQVHYVIGVNGIQMAATADQHLPIDVEQDVWLSWDVDRTLTLN